MSWFNVLNIAGLWKGGTPTPVSETDPLPALVTERGVSAKHVESTGELTTTVQTPTAGKKIRLWWYNMAADPNNTDHVLASLRFGANPPFNTTPLSKYGAATAHSFKAGRSYFEGGVDESLILSKNNVQTVHANIDYEEV